MQPQPFLAARRRWLTWLAALPVAAMARSGAAQTADQARGVLAQIGRATFIAEGRGSRLVYIFFDPNCPYCHQLYGMLRPFVGRDDLQFRWIPLGMLTASSLPKAAAILQAPDRLAAFHRNEDDYDFAANGQPGGGITPATTIDASTQRALAANLAIYRSEKLFGVPVVVWRKKDGAADMTIGVPGRQQLEAILASVR